MNSNLARLRRIPFHQLEALEDRTAPAGFSSLDLVFVIDETGSMEDDLTEIRDSAQDLVDQVKSFDPDARIGIVEFSELFVFPLIFPEPPGVLLSSTTTLVPLTEDSGTAVIGLQSLFGFDGGGQPDNVYSALIHAIDGQEGLGSYRGESTRKAIILIGDGRPRDLDQGITFSDVVSHADQVGVDIFSVYIGFDSSAVQSFREIALENGGEFFQAAGAGDVVDVIEDAIAAAGDEVEATGQQVFEADNQVLFADYDSDLMTDAFYIKRTDTDSGRTEVHVLDGKNAMTSFVFQTATILPETGTNWQFSVTDVNHDSIVDMVGFKLFETESGQTEIHVLDGATRYQTFLKQSATGLGPTADEDRLSLVDYDGDGEQDLVLFKHIDTESDLAEIHVLSAESNFGTFLTHQTLPVEETQKDKEYKRLGVRPDFALIDYDRDGVLDVSYINRLEFENFDDPTNRFNAEVTIFDGRTDFQTASFDVQTEYKSFRPLYGFPDADQFSWADGNNDGQLDLYVAATDLVFSSSLEIYRLSSVRDLKSFDLGGEFKLELNDNAKGLTGGISRPSQIKGRSVATPISVEPAPLDPFAKSFG